VEEDQAEGERRRVDTAYLDHLVADTQQEDIQTEDTPAKDSYSVEVGTVVGSG